MCWGWSSPCVHSWWGSSGKFSWCIFVSHTLVLIPPLLRCGWVAVYCSCISFANTKYNDDTKQIMSSFMLSISAVVMSYLQNPMPMTLPFSGWTVTTSRRFEFICENWKCALGCIDIQHEINCLHSSPFLQFPVVMVVERWQLISRFYTELKWDFIWINWNGHLGTPQDIFD